MIEKIFIDTNIFLYAEFDDGSEKHHLSNKLLKYISERYVYISAQVLNEFYANALRKGKDDKTIQSILTRYSTLFNIVPLSLETVKESWRIINRYQFSCWDSLIVAAALEADCDILYSEDLQDGQSIDNTLKIASPFSKGIKT
jgi:predicted nucleic acid-binding protein